MKNKFTVFMLCSLLVLFIIVSCKPPEVDQPSEKGLTFRVSGIEENSSIELQEANQGMKASNRERYPIYKEISNVNGMDIDLLIEESPRKKRASTKAVTTSPIGVLTKFIIFIFEADENGNAVTFKFYVNSIGGGPTIPLPVYRNTKYRWFAYSFNNDEAILQPSTETPVIDVNSSSIGQGSDFLYATGEITTSNDPNASNSVAITFKRMVSAIRFEVDARGTFSSIKDLQFDFPTSSNGFKNGKFAMRTGQFTETSNAALFSRSTWLDHIADTIPTGWVKYQQLLTVPDGNPMNIQAVLKTLTITSQTINPDNPKALTYEDRSYGVPTAGILLNLPTFTPAPGKRYTIKIRMKESTLLVGGSNWARGNLTYFSNSPKNKYRFWYDNSFVKNLNDGMNNFIERDYFDTRPPRGETQAEPSNWDPCALVYPEKTWRLPTETEFRKLGEFAESINRHRVDQQNSLGWYGSWGNRPGVGPPRFKHKNLNFVAAGYRDRKTRNLMKFNYRGFGTLSADEGYFKTSDTSKFFHIDYGGFAAVDLGIRISTIHDGVGANVRCVRR